MQNSPCSENENVILIRKQKGPEDQRIKAAVYCRVSNKHEELEDSLDNQIRTYRDMVGNDPRYDLVEIYYDFGISGFKNGRPGFKKMMDDARKGRFQLVVTKSITRFARNTKTVLDATRELKVLGIGVYFELQHINTLGEGGELLMTLYAAFGQAESKGSRTGTKMAIKRKMEQGIPIHHLSRVFGYTKNENGEILPDGNAEWVKEIFTMAADGFTVGQITNFLNSNGVKTQTGSKFYRTTVTRILQNEEYKGDFVQMKHYIDEHRKEQKNDGLLPKLYYHEHHQPIVTAELWTKAQKALLIDKPESEEKKTIE